MTPAYLATAAAAPLLGPFTTAQIRREPLDALSQVLAAHRISSKTASGRSGDAGARGDGAVATSAAPSGTDGGGAHAAQTPGSPLASAGRVTTAAAAFAAAVAAAASSPPAGDADVLPYSDGRTARPSSAGRYGCSYPTATAAAAVAPPRRAATPPAERSSPRAASWQLPGSFQPRGLTARRATADALAAALADALPVAAVSAAAAPPPPAYAHAPQWAQPRASLGRAAPRHGDAAPLRSFVAGGGAAAGRQPVLASGEAAAGGGMAPRARARSAAGGYAELLHRRPLGGSGGGQRRARWEHGRMARYLCPLVRLRGTLATASLPGVAILCSCVL